MSEGTPDESQPSRPEPANGTVGSSAGGVTAGTQDPKSSDQRILKIEPLTLSHLFQIGLGAGASLLAIRLLAIAHGDVDLAVAGLSASGYVDPLVGLLLSSVPPMILLAVPLALTYRWSLREAGQRDIFVDWSAVVAILIYGTLSFVLHWLVVLPAFAALILIGIADRWFRRRARKVGREVSPEEYVRIRRREVLLWIGPLLVFNIVFAAARDEPWLPREAVQTEDATVVGYVLDAGDPWMTVLVDEPRHLTYIRRNEVVRREVCGGGSRRTILELISQPEPPPKVPACGDSSPAEGGRGGSQEQGDR